MESEHSEQSAAAGAEPAAVSLDDIDRAAAALRGVAYLTPLQESLSLNELVGGRVFFKLENLQRTGSFKLRGAYNRLRNLRPEQLAAGVVAASAGNHGQGVALAAQVVGTTATVVMPLSASLSKIEATRSYGADVRLVGETFDDAWQEAERIARESGKTLIPAFDDAEVIAGQGTVALEILEQRPGVATLVVPVGGGGLLAGMAVAAKARKPGIRIIGVQSEGSDAFARSRLAGRLTTATEVHTLADGIAVKRPGALPFALVERLVDDIVVVAEHTISRAILLFLERFKLVVEGAGALGLAALLEGRVPLDRGAVAAVVSGGNIDVTLLTRIIEKGLVEEGRQIHLETVIGDRPGQLSRLLQSVADLGANVLRVEHERWNPSLDPFRVTVQLVLETRHRTHAQELVERLQRLGYQVQALR